RIDIEHRHGAPGARKHGGQTSARAANDQNLVGGHQQELGGVDIAEHADAVGLDHGLHAAVDTIEPRAVAFAFENANVAKPAALTGKLSHFEPWVFAFGSSKRSRPS